jgi:hypothetical protein
VYTLLLLEFLTANGWDPFDARTSASKPRLTTFFPQHARIETSSSCSIRNLSEFGKHLKSVLADYTSQLQKEFSPCAA